MTLDGLCKGFKISLPPVCWHWCDLQLRVQIPPIRFYFRATVQPTASLKRQRHAVILEKSNPDSVYGVIRLLASCAPAWRPNAVGLRATTSSPRAETSEATPTGGVNSQTLFWTLSHCALNTATRSISEWICKRWASLVLSYSFHRRLLQCLKNHLQNIPCAHALWNLVLLWALAVGAFCTV